MIFFINTLLFVATLLYGTLLFSIWRAWQQIASVELPEQYLPTAALAVLVAARNEAATIGNLLNALLQQNYPPELLQIIVIDDHSDDETASIVASYAKQYHAQIRLLSATGEGKKAALTQAIAATTAELIVTTDADCMPLSRNWLRHLTYTYTQKNAKAIAAPVLFHQEINGLGRFQTLDFVGMMGVTAAGLQTQTILLCNGANFAFPRTVFYEVGGYAENEQWASGDDVFLLHKIAARYPNNLEFVKHLDAVMLTEPKHDFEGFIAQRVRWGTKNRSYTKPIVTLVLAFVWFYCTLLLGFSLFCWLSLPLLGSVLGAILLKTSFDFYFLRQLARFFKRTDLMAMPVFLPSQLAYIVYLAAIGIAANLVKTYKWKGRSVR